MLLIYFDFNSWYDKLNVRIEESGGVKMKKIYALLMIIGIVIPYFLMYQFYLQYGTDINKFISQIVSNPASLFILSDLLISVTAFTFFMFNESKRLNMKREAWIAFMSIFLVGLSLAIPMFLYLRQDYIDALTLEKGE